MYSCYVKGLRTVQLVRDQGRKIFKIDCTSHVTSPKEKQAPPQGGICFSWAINEGPACDYF